MHSIDFLVIVRRDGIIILSCTIYGPYYCYELWNRDERLNSDEKMLE